MLCRSAPRCPHDPSLSSLRMADPELKHQVEQAIADNPVLLFMKGTPEMPRCGFSMRVVGVLDADRRRLRGDRRAPGPAAAARGDLRALRLADLPAALRQRRAASAAPTSSRRCSNSGELAGLLGRRAARRRRGARAAARSFPAGPSRARRCNASASGPLRPPPPSAAYASSRLRSGLPWRRVDAAGASGQPTSRRRRARPRGRFSARPRPASASRSSRSSCARRFLLGP